MPTVSVTLRPGYLARRVTLRVGKGIRPRQWEIQAGDQNGFFTTDVRVDGEPTPKFRRRLDAFAYLGTLAGQGVNVSDIWAEPRDRRPAAYVTPSDTSGGYSIQAVRA